MKLIYYAPEADLIRFRPAEQLTSQDEFQDTMKMFGTNGDIPSESGDIEVDPWG